MYLCRYGGGGGNAAITEGRRGERRGAVRRGSQGEADKQLTGASVEWQWRAIHEPRFPRAGPHPSWLLGC